MRDHGIMTGETFSPLVYHSIGCNMEVYCCVHYNCNYLLCVAVYTTHLYTLHMLIYYTAV